MRKNKLWTVPQKLSYHIRSQRPRYFEVVLRLDGNVTADIVLMGTPSLRHAESFASKLKLIDETIVVVE